MVKGTWLVQALVLVAVATAVLGLAPDPAAAAKLPSDYLIRVGDTVSLVVQNHPEYSLPSVVVPPDGMVAHPLGERIKLSGKTIQEVTEEVLALLRKELRYPAVTVNVTAHTPMNVSILGEVRAPGTYDLTPLGVEGISVGAAVGMAGGYTDLADRAYVTITPGGQEPQEVALDEPEAATLELRPGDTLVVPRMTTVVTVLGEVNKPGRYTLARDDNLLSVIGQAGDLKPSADRQKALLMHADGGQQEVDIGAVLTGTADPSKLPVLRNGDSVVFLAARNDVVVLGEVLSPGPVALTAQMTMLDALAERGGPTQAADLARTLLVHADGTQIDVDLSGLAHGGLRVADLPPLRGGDTIVLMRGRQDVIVLGEVMQPGRVDLLQKMTVADALAAVGGPTARADLQRIEVTDRDGRSRIVKLADASGDLVVTNQEEARLLGGETVTVHRKPLLVATVLGFVQQPGKVEFEPGERVADVVSRAGGWVPGQARPHETLVIRPGPAPTQAEVVNCDLTKVLQGQNLEQNVTIANGDVVYVPGVAEKPGGAMQDVIRLLGLAAAISHF